MKFFCSILFFIATAFSCFSQSGTIKVRKPAGRKQDTLSFKKPTNQPVYYPYANNNAVVDLDTSVIRDVYRQKVCFSNSPGNDGKYAIKKILINDKEVVANPDTPTVEIDPSKYSVKKGDSCTVRVIFVKYGTWSVSNCSGGQN